MVPKLQAGGKSFKGLAVYLLHDPHKAKTTQRVGWTHTLNMAADAPSLAVDEMLWTLRAAEDLKREAGVLAGGRRLENPVKHFALNWHASENPTREHMIATVESFLKHMGWKDHQALLVCHTDKHPHVHVMLNAVHPETGRALNAGLERRRAQEWAKAYEREHGMILCEERLKPKEQREKSPTRDNWQRMKKAERDHDRAEAARITETPDFFGRGDSRTMNNREWKALKEFQQRQREQFFASGKEAFRAVRNAVFKEVRDEFRGQWNVYYATARSGHDKTTLAEMKVALMAAQNKTLDERRDKASAALREQRDKDYQQLLKQQRFDRSELGARQDQGLRTYQLFDAIYPELNRAEPMPLKQPERQPGSPWKAGDAAARDGAAIAGPHAFGRSAHKMIDPFAHENDGPLPPGVVQRSKAVEPDRPATDGFGREQKSPTGVEKRHEETTPVKLARVRAEVTEAVMAKEPSEKAREMNEREEAKERKEEQAMISSWSRARARRSRGRRD